MSDRIIVIDKGEVMQNGLPNELYNNPQSKKSLYFLEILISSLRDVSGFKK